MPHGMGHACQLSLIDCQTDELQMKDFSKACGSNRVIRACYKYVPLTVHMKWRMFQLGNENKMISD